MGLRDLTIPMATVQVADKSFSVRGLSPNDALGLYYRHAGGLSALFEEFSAKVNSGEKLQAVDVGTAAISGAPRIMAEIIAIASGSNPTDETDWETDVGIALSLSAGIQAAALEKIGGLTFTSEMPLPKFIGLVRAMARTAAVTTNPAT